MDCHNDANNEYIHEDIWRLFVRWFSVAPSHQVQVTHKTPEVTTRSHTQKVWMPCGGNTRK